LPTSGIIRLGGEDVTFRRAAERDIAFVFQLFALYPHMNVRKNIAFPLECAGLPPAEVPRTVANVAERLGLTPLLSRRPRGLAGGDQQRVALGRAMVRRPRIWLMDEPLGTLDADRRLDMCEFLREQQLAAKVTTVYVTHDQEEAMRLADRVVVMSEGRIEQAGAPIQVYDEPASLFVARFVGSPGMNFVQGPLAETAARARGVAASSVTLGVRPEFVRLAEPGVVRGEVVLDEYLGASRCLHVKTAAGTLVARAAPDASARTGATVGLDFDPQHVRLFDAASGARVG